MTSWTQFSEDPALISLAGGLPDTSLFGADRHAETLATVAAEQSAFALNYGPTRGLAATKQCIRQAMEAEGVEVEADELIVTTGGQQVIDLLCRTFLDPGDVVVAEAPTFPGALLPLRAAEAEVVQIPTDEDGIRTDLLADALRGLRDGSRRVKLIYVIPNFQNPSGRTLSLERRHELLTLAREFDLPVLEDNPYGLLRFEGEPVPALRTLDTDGRVLYLGTFSKILAPGLRVGWLAAPPEVLDKIDLAKQCADLCTPTASQLFISTWFRDGDWRGYVERQVETYRARLDVLLDAIASELPAGSQWTTPAGGLFVWVTLPSGIDTFELLQLAMRRSVAFVPGRVGFASPAASHAELRLNFSACDERRIREGMRRLGEAVRELAGDAG